MPSARVRPSVFVGSSSEGLPTAQAVQVLLDGVCEVEVWSQGVFGLTQGTLESLVLALDRFDFAVLVLTADDLIVSRGTERPAARDNVLFELGLFVGGLGRDRTFMLFDRKHPPALPTDLAGVTAGYLRAPLVRKPRGRLGSRLHAHPERNPEARCSRIAEGAGPIGGDRDNAGCGVPNAGADSSHGSVP